MMVGEFVDDYMVVVTDVFAMPQSGTGVLNCLVTWRPDSCILAGEC